MLKNKDRSLVLRMRAPNLAPERCPGGRAPSSAIAVSIGSGRARGLRVRPPHETHSPARPEEPRQSRSGRNHVFLVNGFRKSIARG